MSKILSHYENDIDKAWYNSSNIVYSECDDTDNKLKTVRITFKNGRTYQYADVKVNDYLLFREAQSQGKAFSQYMKSYETTKIEDRNTNQLMEELEELQHPDTIKAIVTETSITIKKGKDILYNKENASNEATDIATQILSVLDIPTEINTLTTRSN